MLIYFCGFAPIGVPIEMIARHTSDAFGFLVVILPLFYLLSIVISPLVSSWQRDLATS